MSAPEAGAGGLPRLRLETAQGATAELYLHGAQLTSWRPAGGDERLFLSERSAFAAGSAIRGGVPVIFPQFAAEGPLPRHGFARTRAWQIEQAGAQGARLVLQDDAQTMAIWPRAFRAAFEVELAEHELRMSLTVYNTGTEPWSFTAALHTYLRVADVAQLRLRGLQGLRYRDSAQGGAERRETGEALRIEGEVDRIYFDTPPQLELDEPARRLRLRQQGFADTVVWNPGAERAAALADLEAGGHRHMLCVEAAAIGRPPTLPPGAHWRGSQILIAD